MPPKKQVKKSLPSKKNGKSGNTKPSNAVKKDQKKESNGKDSVQSKKNAPQKPKGQRIKDFVPVPEVADDDLEVTQDDLTFFNDNQGFEQFLTSIDATELTKNVVKKKKPAQKRKPEPAPEAEQLASSDEEDYLLEEEREARKMSADDSDLVDLEDLEDGYFVEDTAAGRKGKARAGEDSDEEMAYERLPRKLAKEWSKDKETTKLPIKLPGGIFVQSAEPEQAPESEEEESEAEPEPVPKKTRVVPKMDETQDETLKLPKKQYVLSKQEELANTASSILEDPEANINLLKKMRNTANDENETVKKLALLSLLAVFKDIIPGYRIRDTYPDDGTQLSKEVAKQREYEMTLRRQYELYLKSLYELITKKNTVDHPDLACVALRCLCELLTTKTHFNFRLEIMASLVTQMSTLQWNELAQMAAQAIITVFKNDESGRTSFDAVKMLTRMIKSKGWSVHSNVIQLFLHLRLKDEMIPVAHKSSETETAGKKRKSKDKPFINKKARKALKETKVIEKEMQEADAIVSREEKDKNHTETLKLIFAFYFHILKKQASSPLMPAVLEGLAKFAHLISVDFFDDLLAAIKDVMHQLEDASDPARVAAGTRKRLLCIITAFLLFSDQGAMLNYDLKDYYTEMYNILMKTTFRTRLEDKIDMQTESESDLLIEGLRLMFIRKKQIARDRTAAFIKRVLLVSLNMPEKSVRQFLQVVNDMLQKDNRLEALLQSEDRASSGVFLPLLEDPDLCNPFGTSLYELFLYQNHYHPEVRAMAQKLTRTFVTKAS